MITRPIRAFLLLILFAAYALQLAAQNPFTALADAAREKLAEQATSQARNPGPAPESAEGSSSHRRRSPVGAGP